MLSRQGSDVISLVGQIPSYQGLATPDSGARLAVGNTPAKPSDHHWLMKTAI